MKVKVSQPQQEAWSNWKHADGMKFNVKKKKSLKEKKSKKKKKKQCLQMLDLSCVIPVCPGTTK